jgi:hypothetical protein
VDRPHLGGGNERGEKLNIPFDKAMKESIKVRFLLMRQREKYFIFRMSGDKEAIFVSSLK